MPDLELDRHRQLQRDLERAVAGYGELWRHFTDEWRDTQTGNYMWLTYAANYLFACNGYRWAIDPFAMSARVSSLQAQDYRVDLAPLSLVLLTHTHNDHLDLALVRNLVDMDVQWVIPSEIQELFVRKIGRTPDEVITPIPGQWITAGPLRLLPFDSLHMRGHRGVQEIGYLVEMENQRWLFPGDIRNFDFSGLPGFGRLDVVVAHLWLGKAHALDEFPPLLAEFSDFFTRFETERLIITHLNEFGRDETELWRKEHFDLVRLEILRRCPGMRVEKALMGDQVDLG